MASFAAFSAEICAANGVFLRDPLKPDLPAEDHETILPYASVNEMMVLLKASKL